MSVVDNSGKIDTMLLDFQKAFCEETHDILNNKYQAQYTWIEISPPINFSMFRMGNSLSKEVSVKLGSLRVVFTDGCDVYRIVDCLNCRLSYPISEARS